MFSHCHMFTLEMTLFIFLLQAGQRLAHQLEVGGSGNDLCAFLRMSRSTASQSMHNSSTTSLQYLVIIQFQSFKPRFKNCRKRNQKCNSGSGNDLCAFLRMSRSTASQSMHNSSTTSLQYLVIIQFQSFEPEYSKSLLQQGFFDFRF